MDLFRIKLEELIEESNQGVNSNTPDFVLAEYLSRCLTTFSRAVHASEQSEFFVMEFINKTLQDLQDALAEREAMNKRARRNLELVSQGDTVQSIKSHS